MVSFSVHLCKVPPEAHRAMKKREVKEVQGRETRSLGNGSNKGWEAKQNGKILKMWCICKVIKEIVNNRPKQFGKGCTECTTHTARAEQFIASAIPEIHRGSQKLKAYHVTPLPAPYHLLVQFG